MTARNRKKIILILIPALFLWLGLFFVNGKAILIATADSLFSISGFSWSDTVGWTEFKPRYGGVKLDMSTGQISGYAWSDNIGWIYFGPDTNIAKASDAPREPRYWAKMDIATTSSVRIVSGWARAYRPINSEGQTLGGWDGWISMSGVASNTQKSLYSVSVNLASNEFSGWAWGSDTIGWVSFNCSNKNECAISHYNVKIDSGSSSSSSSSSNSSSSSSSSSSFSSSSSSSSSSQPPSISGGGGSFGGGYIRRFTSSSSSSSSSIPHTELTPEKCEYLLDYLKRGEKNNPIEVLKLQVFLLNYENIKIPITTVFDEATFRAVSIFQKKYNIDVLVPWGFEDSTGWVYYTTRKKINEIYCKKDFPLTDAQKNYIARFKAYLLDLRSGKMTPKDVKDKLNELAKKGDLIKQLLADMGLTDPRIKNFGVGALVKNLALTSSEEAKNIGIPLKDKYLLASLPILTNGKLMIVLISLALFIPFAFRIGFNRGRKSRDEA